MQHMRGVGIPRIARVERHGQTLWTAQLAGLTLTAAHETCNALAAHGNSCMVIRPLERPSGDAFIRRRDLKRRTGCCRLSAYACGVRDPGDLRICVAGPMWGRHDYLRIYASAWPGLRHTVGTGCYYHRRHVHPGGCGDSAGGHAGGERRGLLPVALGALYAGIVLGDLGLYGLGLLSAAHPWALRLVPKRRRELGKDWVSQRVFPLVVVSRFVPGLAPADLYHARLSARAVRQIRGRRDRGDTGLDHRVVFMISFKLGLLMMRYLGIWRWAGLAVFLIVLVLVGRFATRTV